MSKFNPFLYIVIPLAVEIQFVEASIDASRIQNKMASLVASIRRGPECPEWIRINGKLGNGELAEQSIIEVGNILQAQSENYTSVLPIYCGNLTPANLNWIGVCYAVKSLCLQVRDYFATKVFSQIIDDITDKAVAKTSVYYDLTDLQIDNLRHDLSYYLRGLKISELVRTFRATHPAVNKLINQAEGWESFLGTSPASAKLARAFKRVIRDGSLEQLVIEAQNQGDFDIRDWFRDWKSDQSIGQIVEVIVNESFQGASGLEAKIGTLPELAVGDMLRSEFRKLFTTRQPILQTLDEQISALSEIPSLPAESPTIILIPEPALQPLPAYHLEPPNLVSRTVRRKAPTRRAAVREVSDLSPSVTEVPNVVGREVSAPSPSVTEVPNVVGREVPDLSPSVTEVPNVVGREVPDLSPSVTEVPNVV
ncbi:MAG: hypothetical protein LBC25_00500, partial [Holosporales bacterium]|nr:hypothetical protein [Holosporales bacterium]